MEIVYWRFVPVMPTYTYFCNQCKKSFEVFTTIANYKEKEKCLSCKCNSSRYYQQDMLTISGSVKKSDSELSTIGDLANRNRDRLSEDQKMELNKKHNSYKDTPSDRPLPKGMSRMKKTNTKTNWRQL